MMNMTAKVLFELTKDGTLTIEVRGSDGAVKAGLLTIIENMAELDGSTTSELLAELSEVAKMTEALEEEMPQEMKDLFDEIFGVLN